MEEIKAIETFYKGCRFRSRLEARWAVIFDSMGIEWRYETEGFTDGQECYLPDFFIKMGDFRWYVEVKSLDRPGVLDELNKAIKFVDGKNISVLLILSDIPQKEEYENWFYPVFYYDNLMQSVMWQRCHIRPVENGMYFSTLTHLDQLGRCIVWDDMPMDAFSPVSEKVRKIGYIEEEKKKFRDACKWFGETGNLNSTFERKPLYDSRDATLVSKLYQKARYARFEHGECG